jgi:hypothetical protein
MRQLCGEEKNGRDRGNVHRDHASILPAGLWRLGRSGSSRKLSF